MIERFTKRGMSARTANLGLAALGLAGDPSDPNKWGIEYAYQVFEVGAADPAAGNLIKDGFALPTEPTGGIVLTDPITSEGKALSAASSWNRKFQSIGKDTKAAVWIKAVGSDTVDTANPLPADAKVARVIAELDTPERDLRHAISLANQSPSTGGAGPTFGTDFTPDVPQTVTVGEAVA